MDLNFYWLVALCALFTISMRALPIILLANVEVNEFTKDWLSFIPSAVMSAIIVSEVFGKPAFTSSGWNLSGLAVLFCLAMGMVTRSLFLTVLTGIVSFMMLGWLLK